MVDISFLEKILNDQKLRDISLNLSKFLHVETIHWSLFEALMVSPLGYTSICRYASRLKNVSELRFDFLRSHQLDDKILSTLGKTLLKLPKLNRLLLHFSDCPQIGRTGIEDFAKSISGLKNIKHFRLLFMFSQLITDGEVLAISDAIMNMESLRKLEIGFSFCQIGDEGVEGLLKAMTKLKHLKHLDLDFSGSDIVTNKAIENVLVILPELERLTQFSFNSFLCKKISLSIFNHLSPILSNFLGMERLEIIFSQNKAFLKKIFQFGQDNLSDFFATLGLLRNLKELSLGISHRKNFSQQEINELSKTFKNLPKLCRVSLLLFPGSGINDNQILSLADSLHNAQYMKAFALNMSDCNEISDLGVKGLADMIYQWKNLNQINLNFSRCQKLTDSSVQALALSVKNHKKLDTLGLTFVGCEKISENGIISLGKILSQINYIQDLTLDFSREKSSRISSLIEKVSILKDLVGLGSIGSGEESKTSESIGKICDSLSKTSGIKRLTVGFRGHKKLENNTVELMFKSFERIKGLKILDLDFQSCTGLDNRIISTIETSLKRMRNLDQILILFLGCENIDPHLLIGLKDNLDDLSSIILGCGKSEFYCKPLHSSQLMELILSIVYNL